MELLEQLGFLLTLLLPRNGWHAWGWPLAAASSAKLIVLATLALAVLVLAAARVAMWVRRPRGG